MLARMASLFGLLRNKKAHKEVPQYIKYFKTNEGIYGWHGHRNKHVHSCLCLACLPFQQAFNYNRLVVTFAFVNVQVTPGTGGCVCPHAHTQVENFQ